METENTVSTVDPENPTNESEDFDLIGEREVWEASGPRLMKENILAKEDSAIEQVINRLNQSQIVEKVEKN